ncbi:MAG: alpha-L-rhamnosidase [Clostridia bacterium]|nr:alpha-L-rhamnosidase [Clostridia bacterium]
MSTLTDKFIALRSDQTDPRTRRYLTPKRIVLTKGNVASANTLLIEKDNQVALTEPVLCVLKNDAEGENAAVLVDFGIEFSGSARIMVVGVGGGNPRANILVRTGESVMEALTPLGVKNTTNDHANRDRVMNVGFYSANETNESGYRFLYVELLDKNSSVSLKALQGVFHYRDLDYIGSFECSDTRVNKIWETAAYTAHLNMQEYLWDGIKRDRLVWIGDMHTEVMTILAAFGYNDVVPKSLDHVRDQTPIGTWMNGITAYSIWWLLIHYEWYMHLANKEYLAEQHEYMKALLVELSKYVSDDGQEILPGRRFLDWPNNDDEVAKHAGLQGLMKLAFDAGAFLMAELGDDETSKLCADTSEKLTRSEPDCNGSKQAASLLALSGISDPKKINEKLLKPNGAHGYSTFFGYYTLAAKSLAGDYEGAMNDMKEYWGGMLDMGATTFWEDFNLDWLKNAAPIDQVVPEGKIDVHGDYGAYCYVKFRHSLCHGWASGPCPWLSRYVLGIQVTEPGFKKVRITPHLGDLTFAKGTYPTPYGAIEVTHYTRDDGTIKSEILLPQEIELEV